MARSTRALLLAAVLAATIVAPGFGARQEETLASLPDATSPAKDAFSEVWVLWDDRAFLVWRDGQAVSRCPASA